MQLPGAKCEVDMQDSLKVIMLGADEWKQAVLLCSLAPVVMGLVMTPETGLELWICFPKVGFGENTQTHNTSHNTVIM